MPGGCRVTLALEFRGMLSTVVAVLFGKLTQDYINTEARMLKARCEGVAAQASRR
jgi:hypothetical protein